MRMLAHVTTLYYRAAACSRAHSGMEGSTDTKASGVSTTGSGTDIISDKNGTWEASLKRSWRPFSLNPCRLFLDFRAAHIVTVEPVVFLYMYGIYVLLFTYQQYFFWRYGKMALALHNSSFPESHNTTNNASQQAYSCISADDLHNETTLTDVQKASSHLLSYVSLPGQIVCIVVSMIFGPLSDSLGRKFIFFSVGIGVVIQGVLAFFIVWFEWNMYLFILGSALSGCFGGFASVLAASFAYAADVSTPGGCRTIRISLIESMIFLSGIVSEGGAGRLLQQLNCKFWPLIVSYTASGVLIILYTALYLPEPLSPYERSLRASDRPKGFRNLLRGLNIFFCRSSYSTWKLWALLGVLVIIVGNTVGFQLVTAIFQEGHPLKWGPAMIGYYDIVTMVTHGVGTIVLLPILVLLSIPDVVIALIGVVFSGAMNLFVGVMRYGWEMFLIGTLSGMEAMIAPSARSNLSKLVSPGDQGALFAFVASAEVLAAAVATAFYPNIFPLTLGHGLRPGTIYFIMGAICVLSLPLLIALLVSMRHTHAWLCCKQGSKNYDLSPPPSNDEEGEEKRPLLQSKHHSPHNQTGSIQ